jgi:Tfp pilus assembly protein PilF
MQNLKNKEDTFRFQKSLDRLLAVDTLCSKAYQVHGGFNILKKHFDSAKYDFKRAFLLDTFSVYSSYYLATIYNLEGKNDSAFYFLNKAIKLKLVDYGDFFTQEVDIPYDELIFFRGVIFFEEGLFQKAKRDFLGAISNGHESGEAFAYLASLYSNENKLDSACFYYRKAMSLNCLNQVDSILSIKCKY